MAVGSVLVCMVENSILKDRFCLSCVFRFVLALLLVLSKFTFYKIYLYQSCSRIPVLARFNDIIQHIDHNAQCTHFNACYRGSVNLVGLS